MKKAKYTISVWPFTISDFTCVRTSVLLQTTHARTLSRWLVFYSTQIFPLGRCLFSGVPLLTPVRPTRRDSVAGWYPAVHSFFLCSDVTFSGAPLLTPVHSMRKDLAVSWYPAVPVFFLSSDVIFSGVPFLVPRVPCTELQLLAGISRWLVSAAGWYFAVHVSFYLGWYPLLAFVLVPLYCAASGAPPLNLSMVSTLCSFPCILRSLIPVLATRHSFDCKPTD